MISRDECTCSCHRTGAIHMVACCTGVFNDPQKNADMEAYYAGVGWSDKVKDGLVHEYRKAIADDCIVGICSVNNCLYPSCSASGKKALHTRLVDDAINETRVVHGHSMLFDKGAEPV